MKETLKKAQLMYMTTAREKRATVSEISKNPVQNTKEEQRVSTSITSFQWLINLHYYLN